MEIISFFLYLPVRKSPKSASSRNVTLHNLSYLSTYISFSHRLVLNLETATRKYYSRKKVSIQSKIRIKAWTRKNLSHDALQHFAFKIYLFERIIISIISIYVIKYSVLSRRISHHLGLRCHYRYYFN